MAAEPTSAANPASGAAPAGGRPRAADDFAVIGGRLAALRRGCSCTIHRNGIGDILDGSRLRAARGRREHARGVAGDWRSGWRRSGWRRCVPPGVRDHAGARRGLPGARSQHARCGAAALARPQGPRMIAPASHQTLAATVRRRAGGEPTGGRRALAGSAALRTSPLSFSFSRAVRFSFPSALVTALKLRARRCIVLDQEGSLSEPKQLIPAG